MAYIHEWRIDRTETTDGSSGWTWTGNTITYPQPNPYPQQQDYDRWTYPLPTGKIEIFTSKDMDTEKLAKRIASHIRRHQSNKKRQSTETEDEVSDDKRGLYQVYVVEPETSEVLLPKPMVASDEARAQMKAAADLALDGDLDDYDFIVQRLGDVRPKSDD